MLSILLSFCLKLLSNGNMSLINDVLFHFICYRIVLCGCFKIPSGAPDSHHYVCYWFVIIINVSSLYPFIMEIFLVFRKCQRNHMIYVTPLFYRLNWKRNEFFFNHAWCDKCSLASISSWLWQAARFLPNTYLSFFFKSLLLCVNSSFFIIFKSFCWIHGFDLSLFFFFF